jgi:hypothetical protein
MRILGKFDVIEPYPAVYIRDIDAIALSDLHLGYEAIMVENGVFLPKVQFKREMKIVSGVLEKKRANRLVINGDIKHEFSETSYHEFKEVSDFFEFLKNNFPIVTAIKGNHDNYLIRVTKRYGVELLDQLLIEDYLFLHGHKVPFDFSRSEAEYIIISHEHPSIALFDEIGVKEKINCFLYGDMLDGRKILVLPPLSIFAQGYDINVTPKEDVLSPILRDYVDVDELSVIGISQETGCLKFPNLGELRKQLI